MYMRFFTALMIFPEEYKRVRKVNEMNKKAQYTAADADDGGMIVGRNPVIEALKSDKLIDTIFINPEAGGSAALICKMAKERGIPIKHTDERRLTAMCRGAVHQGVIAVGACAEYVSLGDILDIARQKNEDPFIIVCDEIEDPHNLGAIIRTAEAAGAHGVVIPKRRSASLNMTVFKTSAGAACCACVKSCGGS